MNKSVIIILILVLVGAGVIIITKQNQKNTQLKQEQLLKEARISKQKSLAIEAKRIAVEQAKLKALEVAREAEAEAQRVKQAALEEVKRLEEAGKKEAEELQSKISGLIAQGRSLLESGNYQQAADLAKNILNLDVDNSQAKLILDTAIAKIEEVVQQQAAPLVKEEPKKDLGALTADLDNQ